MIERDTSGTQNSESALTAFRRHRSHAPAISPHTFRDARKRLLQRLARLARKERLCMPVIFPCVFGARLCIPAIRETTSANLGSWLALAGSAELDSASRVEWLLRLRRPDHQTMKYVRAAVVKRFWQHPNTTQTQNTHTRIRHDWLGMDGSRRTPMQIDHLSIALAPHRALTTAPKTTSAIHHGSWSENGSEPFALPSLLRPCCPLISRPTSEGESAAAQPATIASTAVARTEAPSILWHGGMRS